jgi:hypothetical protein
MELLVCAMEISMGFERLPFLIRQEGEMRR